MKPQIWIPTSEKIDIVRPCGVEVEKMLDSGVPEKYTTELFEQKCGVLFQHVLEKYLESGESVYAEVG